MKRKRIIWSPATGPKKGDSSYEQNIWHAYMSEIEKYPDTFIPVNTSKLKKMQRLERCYMRSIGLK